MLTPIKALLRAAPPEAEGPDEYERKKIELQGYFDLLKLPKSWQERHDEELAKAFSAYALCHGARQARENGTNQRLKNLLHDLKHWSDAPSGDPDEERFTAEERDLYWRRATHLKQLIHQHSRPGNLDGWLNEYVERRGRRVSRTMAQRTNTPPTNSLESTSSWSSSSSLAPCGDYTLRQEDRPERYLSWAFCDDLCEACPELPADFFDSEVFSLLLQRAEMEGLDDSDCTDDEKEQADVVIFRALDELYENRMITSRQRNKLSTFIREFFRLEQQQRLAQPPSCAAAVPPCCGSALIWCGSAISCCAQTCFAAHALVNRWRVATPSPPPTCAEDFPSIPPITDQRQLALVIDQHVPRSWLDPSCTHDTLTPGNLEILVRRGSLADESNHSLSLAVGQIVIHLNTADDSSLDVIEIYQRHTFFATAGDSVERYACDADERGNAERRMSTRTSSTDSFGKPKRAKVILKKKRRVLPSSCPCFPGFSNSKAAAEKSVRFLDQLGENGRHIPSSVVMCGGAPTDADDVLERLAEFSRSAETRFPNCSKETRNALFALKLAMYLLQAPSCGVGMGRKLTDTPRSFCDWLCFLSDKASMDNVRNRRANNSRINLLGHRFALGRSVLSQYALGSGYRELGQDVSTQSHTVDQADWNRLYKSVELLDDTAIQGATFTVNTSARLAAMQLSSTDNRSSATIDSCSCSVLLHSLTCCLVRSTCLTLGCVVQCVLSTCLNVCSQDSQTTPVNLVVFDFDQTLSIVHVFKILAGWEEMTPQAMPDPFSLTQRGQVRRISELNQMAPFSAYGTAGFAKAVFGGDDRVERLRCHLQSLRESGAHIIVCSRGLPGTIRKCLTDLHLLEFFDEVYGNPDSAYKESWTEFDKHVASTPASIEEQQLCVEVEAWTSKNDVICAAAQRLGIGAQGAILVDDDPHEIQTAANARISRVLLVEERAGIDRQHMERLENYVKGNI